MTYTHSFSEESVVIVMTSTAFTPLVEGGVPLGLLMTFLCILRQAVVTRGIVHIVDCVCTLVIKKYIST